MKPTNTNTEPTNARLARIATLPLWFAGFTAYARLKEPGTANEFIVGGLIAVIPAVAVSALAKLRRRTLAIPSVQDRLPSFTSLLLASLVTVVARLSIPQLDPATTLAFLALGLGFAARLLGRPAWYESLSKMLFTGVAAATSFAVYFAAEPYLQYQQFPTFLSKGLGTLMGYTTFTDEGALCFEQLGRTIALGPGPRYAEVYPALLAFVLAGAAVIVSVKSTRARLARLAGLAVATEVYRQIIVTAKLALIASDSFAVQRPAIALAGWALAYAPLLLLGISVAARPARSNAQQPVTTQPRHRLAMAFAALGSLLIAAAFTFSPPGTAKQGRIAVDAVHSQWEWTDVPLNRTLFGTKTTYNFWSMMVYLREFFPVVDAVNEGPLTKEAIDRYDVWILKTPTSPYSDEEVAAFHEYVENGGGIFLVGDHTNIFGMNAYLNQISAPLGITFNPDATFDLAEKEHEQLWLPEKHRIHPTIARIEEFLFATSDTMTIDPLRASPIMTGGPYYADAADYTKLTFFGDHQWSSREPSGHFIQAAVATHGLGRIVAFGDSTVFSSFFVHTMGKAELGLGSVHWLNHRSPLANWPRVPAALGLLALVGATLLGLGFRDRVGLGSLARPVIAGAILGLGLADLGTRYVVEAPPEAHWTLPRVGALCGQPRGLRLRKVMGHDETDPHIFVNFYVGFQRAETIPQTVLDPDRLFEFPFAVMVEPTIEQAKKVAAGIGSYLNGGGRLWLLSDDARIIAAIQNGAGLAGCSTKALTVAPRTWPEFASSASSSAQGPHVHGDACLDETCHATPGGATAHATPLRQVSAAEPGIPPAVLAACQAARCRDAECVHRAPLPVRVKNEVSGTTLEVCAPRVSLVGFEPLLSTEDGDCIHGRVSLGAGQLIVTSNPRMFSEKELGGTTDIPTRTRYLAFEVLWQTIDQAVGRPVKTTSLIAQSDGEAFAPETR